MTQSTLDNSTTRTIICPAGFLAGGLASGIKPSGADDLAMIVCPKGANAAAVYTRNLVCAAPIARSRDNLAKSRGRVRGLVINSGCANAATGAQGLQRAANVIAAAATLWNCPPSEVQINSTGVIGVQLPD